MHSKIDDGIPGTGHVLAVKLNWPADTLDTTAANCVTTASATAYNVANTNQMCNVLVRAQ